VTDPRLLALIKAKVESHDLDDEDIDLLLRLASEAQAEVERLRGLQRRLEWGYDGCPGCGGTRRNGHNRSCWLAAELNPPDAPPRPAGAAPSSGP
jgi:hypothetical protein